MKKYIKIVSNNVQRHLAYRLRVITWILVDVMQFIVFPFIWLSVYGDRTDIAGFTRADIVTYYIVVAFIALAAHSHVSRITRLDVMGGALNQWLVKPITYYWQNFFREVGYKCISIFLIAAITALVYFLFPQYIRLPESNMVYVHFVFFLFVAYFISHMFEYLIGILSFWIGETTALKQVKYVLNTVLNGELAPLHFFPMILQSIAALLPFQYLAYIPAQIFLENITGAVVYKHMVFAVVWAIVMKMIVEFTYRRGLKTYDGVGI